MITTNIQKKQKTNTSTSNFSEFPPSKKSSNIDRLAEFLKKRYKFRTNEIKNRIEFTKIDEENWDEVDEKDLWYLVNSEHKKTGLNYIRNLISARRFSSKYNPLKNWLENLPAPESYFVGNNDPIAQLCNFIEIRHEKDKERLYHSLLKFFVGAIKTLYSKTYVHKQALIFQGPSGIGKTPFVISLLPTPLQEYICLNPSLDPRNKDSKIALTRNMLLIIDEIDDYFKSKSNRDNYKTFMTQKIVTERLPYAVAESSRLRIASFFGYL